MNHNQVFQWIQNSIKGKTGVMSFYCNTVIIASWGKLTHLSSNSHIFYQTHGSINPRSYSSDLPSLSPSRVKGSALQWCGAGVVCVSEPRRVKAPAGWGSWGESVRDRTKSLKVGLVINGIDQPVNATVYILLCLCSLSTTVLNWACSKQPPQGALWKHASPPPLIDVSISWEAVDSAVVRHLKHKWWLRSGGLELHPWPRDSDVSLRKPDDTIDMWL